MDDDIRRAELKNDIPADRFLMFIESGNPPKKGDVVELDQGYTGKDGLPMGTVYCVNEKGEDVYQAEVYDTELELITDE
jgi:hypothetical protein